MLPNNAILGRLAVHEVYEYYDGPRLFSCRSASGRLFLAVWLGIEIVGDDEADSWLYVGLSDARLEQVRTGVVDLYSAFRHAEDGMALQLVVGAGEDRIRSVPCESLTRKHLPVEGERLNLSPAKAADREDVSIAARRELRERLPVLTADASRKPHPHPESNGDRHPGCALQTGCTISQCPNIGFGTTNRIGHCTCPRRAPE